MAYNKDLDYTDLIKQAAVKGDFAMAAALEASRNEKIQSENLDYGQTQDYSNYLDTSEYSPVGSTTSQNSDWSDVINNLISSGASSQQVGGALQSRKTKALTTPGLSQYAYDDVFNRAMEYINQNKNDDTYDALLDSIVNRDAFSYDPMTDPLYQSYATQFKNQGKATMQDTMGEYAGLTGGLPSSAAVSAGQQAYNSQMSKLSGAIPELYGQAYGQYQDEFSNDINALSVLQNERALEREMALQQQELEQMSNASSSSSRSTPTYDADKGDAGSEPSLFESMRDSGNPYTYLTSNYKDYGIAYSGLSGVWDEYQSWVEKSVPEESKEEDSDNIEDSPSGNYQSIDQTLASMKSSGVSTAEILAAIKEARSNGLLTQPDYLSLYNKYRG